MARAKKVNVILKSSRDEQEWIAEAQDGSGLTAEHYLPHTALLVLTDRLREYHGTEVELEHEFALPPSLRGDLEELLDIEKKLQDLTVVLPAKRMELCHKLAKRHLKQQDMAKLMKLSQGYLASIIKRAASDNYSKIRARRRPG